jgi:Conjugative relaxosome accessory transposon protein
MLKKLLTFVMALLVGLQPLTASAADLGAAFSNLMGSGAASSTNAPGRYTSGARNVFVGGGAELRFPSSKATLFSIAPPSFSAGCQGISAHFGGFSFISGDQIEQLVKNIAQGAPGLIINMVIKALCPMCEAVLQNMQKLAQFAAKTNMDSCRIATNLVALAGDALDMNSYSGKDSVAAACGVRSSSVNADSGWGDANRTVCKDMDTAMTNLKGWWSDIENGKYGRGGQPGDGAGKGGGGTAVKQNASAEICALNAGNCTWLVLAEMYRDKDKNKQPIPGVDKMDMWGKRLMLMNLMGTTITGKGVSCGTDVTTDPANTSTSSVTCLPPLEPSTAVGLFMCGNGAGGGETNVVWDKYCGSLFKTSDLAGTNSRDYVKNIPILDCSSTDSTVASSDARYDNCDTLKMSVVADVPALIKGRGFINEVRELLQEAVSRVRNNQAMGTDDKGKQIITLINLAPYPLYQAINAAAVYPEAGQELVDSLTLLVADHLAHAYFARFLKMSGALTGASITISPKMIDRLASGMNALRMEADSNRSRMGRTIASQQMLMEEIRKINTVIQQSVMTDQMLNMQKYANTINTNTAEPSTSGK